MSANLSKKQVEDAISITNSMAEAATKVHVQPATFKRYALKYGLYKPNQALKGVKKPKEDGKGKIPLSEILNGEQPQYQSYKLKHRLYRENIKSNVCETCGISEWNGISIECHLDHIDGNCANNTLENLRILCPNCHSQTETFGYKRGKMKGDVA